MIERSYRVPYLAHSCMEPMNALAHVTVQGCEIWTGSQNPLGFRYSVADALEMDVEQVTFHNFQMGGGFGRRATPDYAIQAAKISRASGHPVKLIWSREEDVRHDHYRPAFTSTFRAVLADNGKPAAWDNLYVDKHEPAEAPHIPYAVPNQNQIVHQALLANSPLAGLVDGEHEAVLDAQPFFGFSLNHDCDLQAFVEVKTRTRPNEVALHRFEDHPISGYLTARRYGPLRSIEDFTSTFGTLAGHVERLAEQRVIPHVVIPIHDAIMRMA